MSSAIPARDVLTAPKAPCCARKPLMSPLLTRGNFYTGIFAHVPQLDNDMVFPSRFQLVKGIFHGTVAGFDFVAPVALSY